MRSIRTTGARELSAWTAFLLVLAISGLAVPAAFARSSPPAPGDRWMEIDLYWFSRDRMQSSVDAFWNRFAPLYAGVEGDRGIILNVGWTVQYIMDWSGDPGQRIVLPTGSGEQPWVAETAPLSGDWRQMQEEWKERFAHPIDVPRRGYEPWTYGDLKRFIVALRATGAHHGIRDLKVGSLTYGWTNAYGEIPPWVKRHPEAFAPIGQTKARILDPGALLRADPRRLGGLPNGIPENMPLHTAFAAQWGSLSKAVGLDAIMLRDSIGMPVPYRRAGPFGAVAPTPEIARRYNANVAALVRETKLANPKALVMMYSNGASAISDWRSNCFDLESIAKEGYLDIFVDQTWAGAWNEVGVRNNRFWNSPTHGWTYQLASMLMHSAILADTKVRHYPLVETFDAWESWDVLHTVPERLRWGIWAYSHAGVKTPSGLKMPSGSYISWANQGKRLLSDEDVHFLAANINAAVSDAHRTTRVFGPTLVYSREAMQWQMDHASPDNDMKEWIDEQAGSVAKWPLAILSATRVEWLPSVQSDLFILQTPVHLSREHTDEILRLIGAGQPVAVFGSPAGGIDPRIEKAAGLIGLHADEASDTEHTAAASSAAAAVAANVPSSFPVWTRLDRNQAGAQTKVLYRVEGSPALTIDTAAGKKVAVWDPPTFDLGPGRGGAIQGRPLVEIWGGSAAPYALTAGALNSLISSAKFLHADRIDLNQTMTVSAWRTGDGRLHLLAGNLEEGLRDDADRSRHISLALPSSWTAPAFRDIWSQRRFAVQSRRLAIDLGGAGSVMLTNAP